MMGTKLAPELATATINDRSIDLKSPNPEPNQVMTSRGISGCERERNYMVAGLHAHETCSGVFSIRTPGIRICPYV